MRKKCYYWTLIALVSVAFSSCSFLNPEKPEFRLSDLQGLWLQTNDTTDHFVRFTTEQSDENPYLYGREWHEKDPRGAIYEQDLIDQREYYGYPGNGWFKYEFETKGDLHEIHLADNKGEEIPKEYIVTKLTESELSYYDKEKKSNVFKYAKIVESKD